MIYTAGSMNSRHLTVLNEQQEPVGRIDYNKWWNMYEAEIATRDNNVYYASRENFWLTSVNLTKNGVAYMEMKYNWGAKMVLAFENGRLLTFKKRSMWSIGNYILLDEYEQEMARVQSYLKLKLMNYSYEMDIYPNSLDKEANEVLPSILVYCTRYLHLRRQ